MLTVIFSKSALLFYFFVILTEFITRYGLKESAAKNTSVALPIGDTLGICAFTFLVFYSFNTVWWAFAALLVVYVLIYKSLKFIISQPAINRKYIQFISNQSRFLVIPVIILMFVLVKR